MKQHFASAEFVAEFAAKLSDDDLWCRFESRHSWDPLTETIDVDKERGLIITGTSCRYCTTERIKITGLDDYKPKGGRLKYPEGYQMPKGQGRIGADGNAQIRREHYRRKGVV